MARSAQVLATRAPRCLRLPLTDLTSNRRKCLPSFLLHFSNNPSSHKSHNSIPHINDTPLSSLSTVLLPLPPFLPLAVPLSQEELPSKVALQFPLQPLLLSPRLLLRFKVRYLSTKLTPRSKSRSRSSESTKVSLVLPISSLSPISWPRWRIDECQLSIRLPHRRSTRLTNLRTLNFSNTILYRASLVVSSSPELSQLATYRPLEVTVGRATLIDRRIRSLSSKSTVTRASFLSVPSPPCTSLLYLSFSFALAHSLSWTLGCLSSTSIIFVLLHSLSQKSR